MSRLGCGLRGAMVAHLTPDQEVASSILAVVMLFLGSDCFQKIKGENFSFSKHFLVIVKKFMLSFVR